MSLRSKRWLLAELPDLVARGVVDEATAERLRSHYPVTTEGFGRRVALAVCAVFGAMLIGGGIILLLAHNWEFLSRPVRAMIALAPLAAAQIFAGWVIVRKSRSTAWREGSAAFLVLSLAAAMALVDQTYHTGGDLESFLWRWALLMAPLPWLMNSTSVAVIFLGALTWWAAAVKVGGSNVLLMWPLALMVVPHLMGVFRSNRHGLRAANLQWAIAIFLCVAAGLGLEYRVPGLWIVVYSGLFAVMIVIGVATAGDVTAGWKRPFDSVGVVGSLILWLVLSFAEPWERVGWRHIRSSEEFQPLASWIDVAMAVVLPAVALGLAALALDRRRHHLQLLWMAPVMVVAVVWPVVAASDSEWIGALAMNTALFTVGVGSIAIGVREQRLATINLGMLAVGVLVVVRFFDSNLGFVARGLVFIAVGIGFLVSNVFLARKLKVSGEDGA